MTNPIRFDVKPTLSDGLAVVAVTGELDCCTAPGLSEVLASVAGAGRVIVVDLRDTDFMDCAGIAPLVAAHKSQHELGSELILDSPRGEVSRVIEWTQLDKFITVIARKGPAVMLESSAR
jgi:anti-sigma B factor antagonist